MTEENKDNFEARIHDLENELRKRDNQLNAYLDKIEGLEVEIMKYEKMFDVKAPKWKMEEVKTNKILLPKKMASYATFKVIIFGDVFLGREMFVQKSLTNLFVSDQKMTTGVDFEVKSLTVDGQKVKLQIWIFGDKERFKFLLPTYVRQTRGGLFLYDVTKYTSLAHMGDWLTIIRKELNQEEIFPIIAVGIIPDEESERHVTREEGIKIAKSSNLNGFIECNPKTGENVEKAFEALARLMLDALSKIVPIDQRAHL